MSSAGLLPLSRFHLLLLYWENTSHWEWTFSTSFPSTCTLIYHHTCLYRVLACPKGINVPILCQVKSLFWAQLLSGPRPPCLFWNHPPLVILSSTFSHSCILNLNIKKQKNAWKQKKNTLVLNITTIFVCGFSQSSILVLLLLSAPNLVLWPSLVDPSYIQG